MVRAPFMDKNGIRKGAWTKEEDDLLRAHVERFGHSNWRALPKLAGLSRCGKSCRIRWMNYLQPGVKHGNYSKQEEDSIIQQHNRLGNKTDNEIKNYWHTILKKKKNQRSSSNEVKEQSYPSKHSNFVLSKPIILESSSYSSNEGYTVGTLNANWMTEDHSQNSYEIICEEYSSEYDTFWTQQFDPDEQDYGFRLPSYEDSIDLFNQIMQELPPF